MTILRKKICMLGDFGVGKTSLVSRFVSNTFSDKYHTTVGVKIDTRIVSPAGGEPVKLVFWDFAGKDRLAALDCRYLRGASGYILVVDGTRPYTLTSAQNLRREVEDNLGPLPFVTFLNKRDLHQEWDLAAARVKALQDKGWNIFETSAKEGTMVAQGFLRLASQLMSSP